VQKNGKYARMENMTPQDIKNLAHLARIEISDQEVADFGKDMESILGYVDQVNQVELSEIEPTHLQKNITRPDTVHDFTDGPTIDQSPDNQDGFYKVPKIL
jgi:aspartyl-tRNA(Asn)/glutamyl-tRNA(Gln) amidotransferase subunit C